MTDFSINTASLLKPMPNPINSAWQIWQLEITPNKLWYLYAWQPEEKQALHLGAFTNLANLAVQQVRFLENPNTCVLMPLAPEDLTDLLAGTSPALAPRFVGQLGSQWSGYNLKPVKDFDKNSLDKNDLNRKDLDKNSLNVEVIYAADFRHEWLGIFSEAEAFNLIEQHYDRRRSQCRLC